MTHVLVKWVSDEKWDIYPLKSLADPAIGLRLMSDPDSMDELRGTVQDVYWKEGEQPAAAELLHIGKPHALERKRAKLVLAAADALAVTIEGEEEAAAPNKAPCTCAKRLRELEAENEMLKATLNLSSLTKDAAKMVKRLKQLTKQKENDEIVPCKKVDIGGGVLVEEGIVNQLTTSCHGGPGKFARALLRHVFEESELKGRSLFGAKGSHGQKEGLDPVRLNAVLSYTCSKHPGVDLSYVKNSLASFLARDING